MMICNKQFCAFAFRIFVVILMPVLFFPQTGEAGSYEWHTFYGSDGTDTCNGMAIDGSGNIYITGTSSATWKGPSDQAPKHEHSTG